MRKGDWIQTFTGKQFWPLDPKTEDIDIEDIAHALSMLCRFNGHCQRFYSVAEHSVIVSSYCSKENALWGLLHDASEAYLADIPRPVKPFLENYHSIEVVLQNCISEKFGLDYIIPDEVKRIDGQLLSSEQSILMPDPPFGWNLIYPPLENFDYLRCMLPRQAKNIFLSIFFELSEYQGEVSVSTTE